jgi:hypothetical protein
MLIAFRKPTSKWTKIVSWWDGSPYSHVEFVFSDGRCFSSRPGEGVGYKNIDIGDGTYDTVQIDRYVFPNAEERIRKFADLACGRLYDWPGILAFGIGRGEGNPAAWYCSEIVLAMLHIGGILVDLPLVRVSPGTLKTALDSFVEGWDIGALRAEVVAAGAKIQNAEWATAPLAK